MDHPKNGQPTDAETLKLPIHSDQTARECAGWKKGIAMFIESLEIVVVCTGCSVPLRFKVNDHESTAENEPEHDQ